MRLFAKTGFHAGIEPTTTTEIDNIDIDRFEYGKKYTLKDTLTPNLASDSTTYCEYSESPDLKRTFVIQNNTKK